MSATAAGTTDLVARTSTRLGPRLLHFVNNGQLYEVALTTGTGAVPAPRQISSTADVCNITGSFQLDSSGLDAWVVIITAGADGNCATFADNPQAFVRSGTPATTAPTPLGSNVLLTTSLRSVGTDDGRLLWITAVDSSAATPKLVAFAPDLSRVDVGGGAGVSGLARLGTGSTDIFVTANASLRRLTANAAALTLGPSLYTFGDSTSATVQTGLQDGPLLYFTDGAKVLTVQAGGVPTQIATLPVADTRPNIRFQAANHLIYQQPVGVSGAAVTSAVGKASGSVVRLLDSSGSRAGTPWGAAGSTLVYFTGSGRGFGDLRAVELDGSGERVLAAGVAASGFTQAAQVVRLDDTGSSLAGLYCRPNVAATDCRGGTLLQIDFASLATTTLGTWADSTATTSWDEFGGNVYGTEGGAQMTVTALDGTPSVLTKDYYLFRPGVAGSLKRVTNNVP